MSDHTKADYTIIKEDPEVLRVLIKNTVEKIVTDGWSDNSVAPRLKELFLNSSLIKDVNKTIDTMWTEQNITDKLKTLHKVEKENPADFIAWRPAKTGSIPKTNLKGEELAKEKQILLNQVEKQKIYKEKLKNVLNTNEDLLNKYITKLSEASEYINNDTFVKGSQVLK